MVPDDTTPHGREIMHEPPERAKYPQPKQGEARDEEVPGTPRSDESADERDPSRRPALPEHPQRMPVDIEDEEADPVTDSGPGIDDGVKSLKKQRG
jgi:hypothetical protein